MLNQNSSQQNFRPSSTLSQAGANSGLKTRPLSAATFKGIYSKKQKQTKFNLDAFLTSNTGSFLVNGGVSESMHDDRSEHDQQDREQRHNVYNEIVKKRPLIAKVDKEKLYEESVRLQRELDSLREDQVNLMADLQRVENEKLGYQKLISQVETFVDEKKGQKISLKESWLVINLKKQLHHLQHEISQRKQTVTQLKRDPFTTSKQESEIMSQIFNEYSVKYRKQTKALQKQAKPSQQQLSKQKSLASQESSNSFASEIQQKEVEQECDLLILQSQHEQLQTEQNIIERKVAYSLIQASQIKEELKEKDEVIKFLKEEIKRAIDKEKNNKETDSNVNSFKNKAKNKKAVEEETKLKKNNEIEQMKDPSYQIFREKDQQLAQNQQKISYQKEFLQEITNREIKSKNKLNEELGNLRIVLVTLKEKYEQLTLDSEDANEQFPSEPFPKLGPVFTIHNDILEIPEDRPLIKVAKVTSTDIKIIAHEIKLRLTLKMIPLVEAVKKLFSADVPQHSGVSIDEMLQRLRMSPFAVKSYQDALLFSRFLIEDNQDDSVILDVNRTNNYRVVRSVFKNAIGQIKIKEEEEEFTLWKQISQKIRQFELGIKQQFELYDKSEQISSDILMRCLEETLNEITAEEQEYVLMRMFEATNNFLKLRKDLLFEIFGQNSWKTREERKKAYQVYLEEGAAIEDQVERFPTEVNSLMSSQTLETDASPRGKAPSFNPPQPSQFKLK